MEEGGTVFGSTPGDGWRYVEIEPQTEEVVVRVKANYPQVREREVVFYQGNATEMYIDLIQDSASYMGYMLLMLMIAPFVLFVREFFELGRDKISYVICMASFANIIVCTTLHMTGILEFKQTATCTHLLMLTVAVLVDLAAYYTGAVDTDIFVRFGLLIYIMLLGKEAAKSTMSKIKVGRKAEVYRELAVKDILTGTNNRNAYDEWVVKNHDPRGTAIITFEEDVRMRSCIRIRK